MKRKNNQNQTEHIIPVRKGNFLLGRVRHPRDNPEKFTIKIIKAGIPKKIAFNDFKEIYIIDDITAEKIIKDQWSWYVKHKYRNIGKKSKKEEIEHPVQLKRKDLRKYTAKLIEVGSVKYYFPQQYLNRQSSFLDKCREISSKIGDREFKFNREEIYEDF